MRILFALGIYLLLNVSGIKIKIISTKKTFFSLKTILRES